VTASLCRGRRAARRGASWLTAWRDRAQEDAGTGSTLLLSMAGPLLETSVRLVHEGRSLQSIVLALRRVQAASRILLDAAAVHVHQLGPCAVAGAGDPSADRARQHAEEMQADDFSWFDELSVNEAGQVDTRQLRHERAHAVRAHEIQRGSPLQGAQRGEGPGHPEPAAGNGAGSTHNERPETWCESLAMGLSHGNDVAMRLAIHAVASLHRSSPVREPSASRPRDVLPAPRTQVASGLTSVECRRLHRARWPPCKSRQRAVEPGGAEGQVVTVLAPGLDAAKSAALAGMVVAVSEAPHLLRCRLRSLCSRAAAAGVRGGDAPGASGWGNADEEGSGDGCTRARAMDVGAGWLAPDLPVLRRVRLVVGATGALRRSSLAAERGAGAGGEEGVTVVIETREELREYEREDAHVALKPLVQALVCAGCGCLLLQDAPSAALADLLHARGTAPSFARRQPSHAHVSRSRPARMWRAHVLRAGSVRRSFAQSGLQIPMCPALRMCTRSGGVQCVATCLSPAACTLLSRRACNASVSPAQCARGLCGVKGCNRGVWVCEGCVGGVCVVWWGGG
jgi:hypothetical protein